MISKEQEKIIKQIVQVFETGKVGAESYSTVALLQDGAGISYGKSQATDKHNNLDAIVQRYIDKKGIFAQQLEPYLDELFRNETATVNPLSPPKWVSDLMELLKKAGNDPIMHLAQDIVFDEKYYYPAVSQGKSMKLSLALSYGILYDTSIHSGPNAILRMRRLFPELPPTLGGDEKEWAKAYVKARRKWLSEFSNPVVQKTVYRMDAFSKMIEEDNWNLDKPVKVLGVKIS